MHNLLPVKRRRLRLRSKSHNDGQIVVDHAPLTIPAHTAQAALTNDSNRPILRTYGFVRSATELSRLQPQKAWNSLPAEVTSARSLQTFKSKTEDTPFFCLILVIFLSGLLLYCKVTEVRCIFHFNCMYVSIYVIPSVHYSYSDIFYKKAQLSLTNPRDACEKFARFT